MLDRVKDLNYRFLKWYLNLAVFRTPCDLCFGARVAAIHLVGGVILGLLL